MASTSSSGGAGTAGASVGGSGERDLLADSKELLSLAAALPAVFQELRNREMSEERFTAILDKYQELPHLLDPYLETLVNQLFVLTQQDMHPGIQKQAFRYLYLISKCRGPKVMVRWFPHEVKDFEPVLVSLQQQDPSDAEMWETRYILLLWLSFLLMIPFDLSRLDGATGSGQKVVDRVFDIAKLYIGVSDKCRDAAASLLAKLVTRQDVKDRKLEEYVDWAFEEFSGSRSCLAEKTGILSSVSFLLKHGKREDLLPLAPRILTKLKATSFDPMASSTQLRKLHAKVVQWVGITFLPPRLAKWRYHRGARSLEEALSAPPFKPVPAAEEGVGEEEEEEEEEEYDVPEELEDVLELLLKAVQDWDTVVRWTAAKGVGKVTGRLPRELADEVLQSLLQLFISPENDVAWHGGCLTLAELGRRGLLLPQRLSQVVPVMLKALAYDVRRGACTVGAHVRDAACYVVWSFARAYQPQDLAPYVQDIARALVVGMVYDREVNCRRAASAAFQENVGRQGTFPHGIDILTTADYFALGNINNAYLSISLYVAQFEEYTRFLIDHLYQQKLLHWDSPIRELAAKTLHKLTSLDREYMKNTVLPTLLPLVTDPDPCQRHGALHAVSEVCGALSALATAEGKPFTLYMGQDMTEALLEVVPKLRKASVFKGAVGEMMRPATLKFIECMCGCGLPLSFGDSVLEMWQGVVEDNLSHVEESIRNCAVSAFSCLCDHYYSADAGTITSAQEKFIPAYTSQLVNTSDFIRMGYSLALGGLPRALLCGKLHAVLDPLIQSCQVTSPEEGKFAEARGTALVGITRICCTVAGSLPEEGVARESGDLCLSADDVGVVLKCLMGGLEDYTMDSRGDIGAVVREAAMDGIHKVLSVVTTYDSSLLTPLMVSEAVCGLVQQSNEKIDRTRAFACQALVDVLFHQPTIPHIPSHTSLRETFHEAYKDVDTNWLSARMSFPLTVQLLKDPSYRYHTLLGLVLSVGGLAESTVRHASEALLNYLKPPHQKAVCADISSLDPFAESILTILHKYSLESRVILPLLKTLDLLLCNGVFDVYVSLEEHSFPPNLLELLNKEVKSCKDAVKLLASINVFCGLLQFPSIRTATLNRIMLLLCHTFPKVRKSMADQFYVTLLTYEDLIDPTILDHVMSIISDTTWDGVLASVREQRNVLCNLFALPIPKLLPKASGDKKKLKEKDDLSSYKDLVDREGY